MHKLILIPLIVFGFIFSDGIFREEIYELVSGKGTVNVFGNPTSPINGAAKQDGNELVNLPGQEVYRSVDEKGTINFSEGPASPVTTTKGMSAKQEREEILKRNQTPNRPMTDSEIKAALLTMPTWRGSASRPGWGSSGTVRRGKS